MTFFFEWDTFSFKHWLIPMSDFILNDRKSHSAVIQTKSFVSEIFLFQQNEYFPDNILFVVSAKAAIKQVILFILVQNYMVLTFKKMINVFFSPET